MASTAVKMLTVLRPKGSYLSTILGTAPIALWPLSETSGTTAVDVVGGYNGTYANVTLNAATFPSGTAAPSFDGSLTSYANLYSAGLASVFNGALGTALIWARVAAGFWTDNTGRALFNFGADSSNFVRIDKATNNQLRGQYSAGGTIESAVFTVTPTTWFQIGLTWDKANDRVRVFYNGAQQGVDQTSLGIWAGALASARCGLANVYFAPIANFEYVGAEAFMALWAKELTPAEVASLAPAPFQV